MLNIKTNALSEKGELRGAVRKVIKESVNGVQLRLSNDSVVDLEYKGNGDYFGAIAVDENGVPVYAKISLVITTADYKLPIKKTEVIEVE